MGGYHGARAAWCATLAEPFRHTASLDEGVSGIPEIDDVEEMVSFCVGSG
jgi:hypothetical protein